jgi:hypothetical protein
LICASSIGFNASDTSVCEQFGSGSPVPEDPRKQPVSLDTIFANTLAGNTVAAAIVRGTFTSGVAVPYVKLNEDPCDRYLSSGTGCTLTPAAPGVDGFGVATPSLNEALTDEQEALLGCGPYWGSDCERDGIDLANADASVLLQSWSGFTIPVVGSRGPTSPGYDPLVDGCVRPGDPLCSLAHPLSYSGVQFTSEMAALSWNLLMTLVAFSQTPGAPPTDASLDPADPYSLGEGQCSFAQPQYCSSVISFFALADVTLSDLPARAAACTDAARTTFDWNHEPPFVCGPELFGSPISVSTDAPLENPKAGDSIASLWANAFAGNAVARSVLETEFTGGAVIPFVALREDPCDALESDGVGSCNELLPDFGPNPAWTAGGARTLNQLLSGEQEALLGCGQFWGADCEGSGIDVFRAEFLVLLQSWTGMPGNYGAGFEGSLCTARQPRGAPPCPVLPDLTDYCIGCTDPDGDVLPVPGTVGFEGLTPGARYTDEGIEQVPGARGPTDPGYDPEQDGSTTDLAIPTWDDPAHGVVNGFADAAGLPFRSELAALSWNALMTLVALSGAADPEHPAADDLDPADPARIGPGLCSFRQPQFCRTLALPAPEPGAPLAGAIALVAIGILSRRR